MVEVRLERDVVLAVRAEIRELTGHSVEGFTSTGQPLVVHDRRGLNDGCRACELLRKLDAVLHPGEG